MIYTSLLHVSMDKLGGDGESRKTHRDRPSYYECQIHANFLKLHASPSVHYLLTSTPVLFLDPLRKTSWVHTLNAACPLVPCWIRKQTNTYLSPYDPVFKGSPAGIAPVRGTTVAA